MQIIRSLQLPRSVTFNPGAAWAKPFQCRWDGVYYEYSFQEFDYLDDVTYKDECLSLFPLGITLGTTQTFPCLAQLVVFQSHDLF